MKEQEECGWVWGRVKSPGSGTDSGLTQTGAYSRDHSASVSSSPLQRLGGEVLWSHTITVNITTLSKHNWTKLDRWEWDRRKGWSFTADTRKDRNILLLCCGNICRGCTNILTGRFKYDIREIYICLRPVWLIVHSPLSTTPFLTFTDIFSRESCPIKLHSVTVGHWAAPLEPMQTEVISEGLNSSRWLISLMMISFHSPQWMYPTIRFCLCSQSMI